MESASCQDQHGVGKVLVVAPRFPIINQPWMDTYIEQLLVNGFACSIYSANKNPTAYQEKVDRLNLRSLVVPFDLLTISNLLTTVKRKPFLYLNFFFKSLASRKTWLGSPALLAALKYANFGMELDKFKEVSLIHAHEEIAGYEFLNLSQMLNIPFVLTFHGLPPLNVPQLPKEKRDHLYRIAKRVFVNTQFAKKQVVSLGCDANKVVILPQGLPIEDFPFRQRTYKANINTVSLLSVGRFQRDKGHHYVMYAVKRLLDQGINVTYDLVGVGEEWLVRLKKIAKNLNIESVVRFHQDVSSTSLLNLYHGSDLFVLSSIQSKSGAHTETQGVVLQEAQSAGCVPIASEVGGVPECLNHKENALLVKQRSSREIVKAVVFLLKNPDRWEAMSMNGRKHIEENFSASVVGKKMAAELSSLIREA